MKKLKFIKLLMFVFISFLAGSETIQAAVKSALLEKIRKDNLITIGVKTDFAPFGYLSSDGVIQGFEVELASKIAKEMGVGVKLVGVTTANRFQRLEQGAVDLVVATAADTRERRKLATAIEPGYFGAGVTVLLRPEVKANSWQELRGKSICALQGAYFNKGINSRYVLDLKAFKTIGAAQSALKQGGCVGFLYSEMAIQRYLARPEFANYTAKIDPALVVPWAAFLPRSEKGTDFEHLIGNIIADFHRTGALSELQKKWQIADSKFLRDSRQLWSKTDEAGNLICKRSVGGEWPVECREKAFITSADVQGVGAILRIIDEKIGLDFNFVSDTYDRKRFLYGILTSVLLIFLSTLMTVGLGILGAIALTTKRPSSRAVSGVLAFCLETTPPLLSMYLVFFGVGALVSANYGVNLSAFWVAVLCLSIYHGAMISKTIATSVELKKKDNPNYSFSISRMPQILETAGVGINGILTNLVKASMIASAIAVPELLASTLGIISDQGNTNEMMILLFLLFFGFTSVWISIIRYVQVVITRKYGHQNA